MALGSIEDAVGREEAFLGHSHKLLVAFLAVAVPVCLLIVSKSSLLLSEVVAPC